MLEGPSLQRSPTSSATHDGWDQGGHASQTSGGSHVGKVVGIALAAVGVAICFVFIVVFRIFQRKHKRAPQEATRSSGTRNWLVRS
jgi:hypothetical protein